MVFRKAYERLLIKDGYQVLLIAFSIALGSRIFYDAGTSYKTFKFSRQRQR